MDEKQIWETLKNQEYTESLLSDSETGKTTVKLIENSCCRFYSYWRDLETTEIPKLVIDKIIIPYLVENKAKIDEFYLQPIYKYYPEYVDKIIDRIDKAGWETLCCNENAIPVIEKYINNFKIYRDSYAYLCTNPNAIPLIEKYGLKICWFNICSNPNAIPLIKKNLRMLDQECWENLKTNPNFSQI